MLLNLIQNIPEELKASSQWVVRKNKMPLNANDLSCASTTDPKTWCSFDTAVKAYRAKASPDGIGYVFKKGEGIVGIDIDTCRDPKTGKISKGAQRLVELFDSYTEISPSGYGLHIFIKADPNYELPFNRFKMNQNAIERYENKDGKKVRKEPEIEIYNCGRYFTVTGNLYGSAKPLAERTEQLNKFFSLYPSKKKPIKRAKKADKQTHIADHSNAQLTADDRNIIMLALRASSGEKFSRLYKGDIGEFSSQSSADQSLCNMLAFWCRGNTEQMDRIFRSSGLYRTKWDESRGESTYGENTINNAINDCTNFYEGKNFKKIS